MSAIDFGDCIKWNCPGNWFRRLSVNWNYPENWFRILSITWNCPDNGFRKPSSNWNCVSNRFRVLSMNWIYPNNWFLRLRLSIAWNCPEKWFRVLVHELELSRQMIPSSWNCLTNWFRVLPIIVRTTDFLCCVKRRAVWTLLLCRGTSGSAHEVTHTRCLTDAWKMQLLRLVACLLAHRMPSERRGEGILIQVGDNACQVWWGDTCNKS